METFERDDFFASGTFGGETISLAACLATVNELEKNIFRTVAVGADIQGYFNRYFKTYGASCEGYPTRLIFKFPTKAHSALFMQQMCLNGVLIGQANMVMSSLIDWDLGFIKQAIKLSYSFLKANWENPAQALKGPMPEDALRKSI